MNTVLAGRRIVHVLLFCLAFCCTACVRHADSSSWIVLRSGALAAQGGPDIARIVYADVRRERKPSRILHSAIASRLAAAGFEMTETPSRAGYIFHVNVAASGDGDAASAQRCADAGFGGKIALRGRECAVVVADVLLVERRIPEARKARARVMRSIGRRNAVADSRMRAVLLQPKGRKNGAALITAVADALAAEACRPLEGPIPPAASAAPKDSPASSSKKDEKKKAEASKNAKKKEGTGEKADAAAKRGGSHPDEGAKKAKDDREAKKGGRNDGEKGRNTKKGGKSEQAAGGGSSSRKPSEREAP